MYVLRLATSKQMPVSVPGWLDAMKAREGEKRDPLIDGTAAVTDDKEVQHCRHTETHPTLVSRNQRRNQRVRKLGEHRLFILAPKARAANFRLVLGLRLSPVH